jgi:hypothetical protein
LHYDNLISNTLKSNFISIPHIRRSKHRLAIESVVNNIQKEEHKEERRIEYRIIEDEALITTTRRGKKKKEQLPS